jgi:hypothetical protein
MATSVGTGDLLSRPQAFAICGTIVSAVVL